MGKTAGVISINLNAGTAQFILDMEKANASVKRFGQSAGEMGGHGVTGVQAVSGALRVLEGGITNNLRAAERFTANVLGLGPVLQAAFPVIGAIAFLGVISKLGEEVHKFYTEMRDAPEKILGEFANLNAPMAITNDQMRVTNEQLQNQINKLEGRRENTLKLAIYEARLEADKLTDSLERSFQSFYKLADENKIGFFRQLFGEASNFNVRMMSGGLSGFGGIQTDLRNAKSPQEQAEAIKKQISDTERLIGEAEKRAQPQTITTRGKGQYAGETYEQTVSGKNETANIEQLQAYRQKLKEAYDSIDLTVKEGELKGKLKGAEAAKSEQQIAKPFEDRVAKLKSDISAASLKLDAAGQGEAAKVLAKANGDAVIAIEEVNKAMAEHSRALTIDRQNELTGLVVRLAKTNADEQWATKLAQTTQQIRDQVEGQKMLTAAIGQGYEAVKKANVENELMSRVGPDAYSNSAKRADIAALRSQLGGAYDANHGTQVAESVDKLNDQIGLEIRLAQVQSQGAEAVRFLTFQATLEKLKQNGATQEQINKEIALYHAQRVNAAAADLSKVNERIEAVKRLAAAQVDGAEAVRRAELQNQIAEIRRSLPAESQQAAIDAATRSSQAGQELKVAEAVGRRVTLYSQHLSDLEAEAQYLKGITVTEANRLDIIRAGRDIENERLHVLSQQALSLGTARDGIRAFFIEMQADGKKAAQTVYDALNSALDGISSNFAKFMSGQKTAWRQMFQGIAEGVFKDQVETQLRQGVRDIAKHFPGLANGPLGGLLAGKPDGSSSDRALWVRMSGPALATPGTAGSPGGGFPGHGSIFGGSQGGLIFNLVSPSAAYRSVAPSASPNRSSSPESRGDGRPNVYFGDIIVNGGEPESNRRGVLSAIQQAMAQAVATSVQVGHDQTRRMPGSRA